MGALSNLALSCPWFGYFASDRTRNINSPYNKKSMIENTIKVLLKSTCPHCGEEILVEVENQTPIIKGILTEGDITAAKEYAIKELTSSLEKKGISKEDFDDAIKWIKDENTIFGPKDVGEVLESIKNPK